jgi:hypothetical protein
MQAGADTSYTPPGWNPGECDCTVDSSSARYSEISVGSSVRVQCAASRTPIPPCYNKCNYRVYKWTSSQAAYVQSWTCKWRYTCICTRAGSDSVVVEPEGSSSGSYPMPPTPPSPDPVITNYSDKECGWDWQTEAGCPVHSF